MDLWIFKKFYIGLRFKPNKSKLIRFSLGIAHTKYDRSFIHISNTNKEWIVIEHEGEDKNYVVPQFVTLVHIKSGQETLHISIDSANNYMRTHGGTYTIKTN